MDKRIKYIYKYMLEPDLTMTFGPPQRDGSLTVWTCKTIAEYHLKKLLTGYTLTV